MGNSQGPALGSPLSPWEAEEVSLLGLEMKAFREAPKAIGLENHCCVSLPNPRIGAGRLNFLPSPCLACKQLPRRKGRRLDRPGYLPLGMDAAPQETLADPRARARNPRNALVSRSSLGPRGEGYALQAGQPRAVDPMSGELAEGAPPGWGRIAPRAGAGCGGERGSRGSWRRWGGDFGLRARFSSGGRARPPG